MSIKNFAIYLLEILSPLLQIINVRKIYCELAPDDSEVFMICSVRILLEHRR